MIVQHNMAAANANRQLAMNATNLSKSTEKLSSGYRINRAGDDAAGLSISEKMRGQIRGLDQASTNAQDGISLIQTAEGALDETHSILQRMRELAVQAANDTNANEDRDAINEEITQLTKEIDRIADTTQYNTKNLLDGSFSGTLQIGANANQSLSVRIDSMKSSTLGLAGGVQFDKAANNSAGGLKDGIYTIATNAKGDGLDLKNESGQIVGTVNGTNGEATLSATNAQGTAIKVALGHAVTAGASVQVNGADTTLTLAKPSSNVLAAGDYKVNGTTVMNGDKVVGTVAGDSINLEAGGSVLLSDLGMVTGDVGAGKTFTIKAVDVSTSKNASGSLDTIDAAIKTVSSQRSTLGAIQNRLEHTISNLDNSSENLQSAESRIRDVDMADEMVKYSKSNILQQASQSMLAQAKNSTQGVLSLLQ